VVPALSVTRISIVYCPAVSFATSWGPDFGNGIGRSEASVSSTAAISFSDTIPVGACLVPTGAERVPCSPAGASSPSLPLILPGDDSAVRQWGAVGL
jgi:hypothetical protein